MELSGQLKAAEDIKGHRIRLENAGQASPWVVAVPPGMMVDIVKPLWDELVIVTVGEEPEGIFFKSIRRAEEE